jgi:hypothetical protein
MGEMKKVGHRFGSVRLLAHGGEQQTVAHGEAAPTGATAAQARPRKKKARVGPVLGRKAVVTWAGVGISKENWDGLTWPLGRIDGLNRRAYRNCFQIYFKNFDSNQRVLNIFKPNLN